jgi:P-type E1-E2 ATPase
MKAFQRITPDDAEVKRNNKWIRYDAASLVTGDIIRIQEGDRVPADCTALTPSTDLLVDHRQVTGEEQPRTHAELLWGAHVVQGSALCIVTAIGQQTHVARLIREKNFPPHKSHSTATADQDEVGNLLMTQRE